MSRFRRLASLPYSYDRGSDAGLRNVFLPNILASPPHQVPKVTEKERVVTYPWRNFCWLPGKWRNHGLISVCTLLYYYGLTKLWKAMPHVLISPMSQFPPIWKHRQENTKGGFAMNIWPFPRRWSLSNFWLCFCSILWTGSNITTFL